MRGGLRGDNFAPGISAAAGAVAAGVTKAVPTEPPAKIKGIAEDVTQGSCASCMVADAEDRGWVQACLACDTRPRALPHIAHLALSSTVQEATHSKHDPQQA